jgi:hypothetical protein
MLLLCKMTETKSEKKLIVKQTFIENLYILVF